MAENQIELLIKANDQASASLNKITGQIKSLETGAGTAGTSMDGLGKATGSVTSRIVEFAAGMFTAQTAVAALGKVWDYTIGAFEKGIKSIDNLRLAQAAMAGAAATNDPSIPFEKAYDIAGKMVAKVQQLSATFVGTGDELAMLAQAMVTFGLGLDLSNEKAQKNFVSFANMFKIMTAGQEFSRQAMSEIRALAQGQEVAGAMVIRYLEAAGINVKQMLPIWKEQGTVIENIMGVMKGYDEATGKIANTLQAQKTTSETIALIIGRAGTAGAYADILSYLTKINKSLMDQNGLTEKGQMIVDAMRLSWLGVSTAISASATALEWLTRGTIAYYNVTKGLAITAKHAIFGPGKMESLEDERDKWAAGGRDLKLPPSPTQITEAQLKAAEHIQKMVEDLADKISVERAMARGGEVEAAFEKARIDYINRNGGVAAAAEAAGKAADMDMVNLALRLSDEQLHDDRNKALQKYFDEQMKIEFKNHDLIVKQQEKDDALTLKQQERFLGEMDRLNEAHRYAQERMPRPWDTPGDKERQKALHDFMTEQNRIEKDLRENKIDQSGYEGLMGENLQVYKERLKQIEDATSEATARVSQLWTDMSQGMESQFTEVFMNAFQGKLKSLGDYFHSFANMIAAAWSRAMGNMLTDWIQTQARMSSEGSIVNSIGKWIGGALGMNTGGGWTPENSGTFAKGDVFGSPRVFRFAQGIGMLGEAGPEGVLPLKRTASGDLGVIAAGGGGGNVTVNVQNNTGQPIEKRNVRTSFDAQGMVIDMVIDAVNRDVHGARAFFGGR